MKKKHLFQLTADQKTALKLLSGRQTYTLLYGGSRSGKTFLLVYALLVRSLREPGSRHIVLRLHANAAQQSIRMDTLPKVIQLAFPGLSFRENKSNGCIFLPNGSEIWLAGLDASENPEKILGREFATIYFNECSELEYSVVSLALTRLAQKTNLQNRVYFDCNPAGKSHWTYLLFIDNIDPATRQPLTFPGEYRSMVLNPNGNRANLPDNYIEKTLAGLPERQRLRFLEGKFLEDDENALWKRHTLERCRIDAPPVLARVAIAVDPAVTSNKSSDETGIIVAGSDDDGNYYVLEDLSCRSGAERWMSVAATAAERYGNAKVICEINNGGELFEKMFRTVAPGVFFRPVRANRNKLARAEPVAALYERGKVFHCGRFDKLEEQMCNFSGLAGQSSPDRLDALVWVLTELALKESSTFKGFMA